MDHFPRLLKLAEFPSHFRGELAQWKIRVTDLRMNAAAKPQHQLKRIAVIGKYLLRWLPLDNLVALPAEKVVAGGNPSLNELLCEAGAKVSPTSHWHNDFHGMSLPLRLARGKGPARCQTPSDCVVASLWQD